MRIEVDTNCATLRGSYVRGEVHDVPDDFARDLIKAGYGHVYVFLNPALQDRPGRPPGFREQLTERVREIMTRRLFSGRS